ncbi:hypothetical protein SPRG_10839 [Saprolegnia parasitica CBS 223.65]|uniref:Uncharacterized protein n=1 Tax=Saprolegnia parasitica (strain CBS 223.65) TaxID=695850 RepID=A0A067CBX9_SAPPC|nr:hypothetical protein SPRG_10839 [Saprolegnia parasitica CBS 223.65]KDO24051.1 hypothetical protein SPRG_10839 [Saprolegnia parasitica CBS 223.65]|eukprot:XP_012205188.1 hypothetical protein SPRG_10839 [Saprolegnia parasitica CBS 223.65]
MMLRVLRQPRQARSVAKSAVASFSDDATSGKRGKAKQRLFQQAMEKAPLKPQELDAEYSKYETVMDNKNEPESDYTPLKGRVENELIMADKSWPLTSGTDLFMDLIQIPATPFDNEKRAIVNAEAFKRMGYTSIWDVQLPEIAVEIPADHPDYDALMIMKQSLMNNGRIKMDDKNEIMEMLLDEINRLSADTTELVPGIDLEDD